tara:strand:+ start:196 stop:360 length:165 start_codon:yes stop_codon:yes gene_type:complete
MSKEFIFRKATKGDIRNVVKMLADDELGSAREDYKVPIQYIFISLKSLKLNGYK